MQHFHTLNSRVSEGLKLLSDKPGFIKVRIIPEESTAQLMLARTIISKVLLCVCVCVRYRKQKQAEIRLRGSISLLSAASVLLRSKFSELLQLPAGSLQHY